MYQDQITELLHLHARLERQLKLATLDDDVGEIEQVNLERVQHALPCDNDLLRLFFNRQRSDQCGNFFGSLPLRKLSETLLTSPDAGVDNLQEQLPRAGVEDEDGSVCAKIDISFIL